MRAPSRPGPLAALLSERGAKLVQRSALVVLVLGTVYSAWGWDGPWRVPGRLPGLRPAILSLFVLEVLLLLVLALAVGVQRPWRQGVDASLPQDGGGYRVAMRGFGAPVVAAAAFLVAGGFSAGLTYRVAELLGHPVLSQVTASEELVRNQLVAASPEVRAAIETFLHERLPGAPEEVVA